MLVRRLSTIVLAVAALAVLAVPAAAHVTVNPSTATAGAFAKLDLRVPHGCEGQATEVVSVRIAEGVVSVVPEQVPGWDVATETGVYDEPVDLHGELVTEGVRVVTWTAQPGQALPDGRFVDFGLSVRLPEADGPLYFPAVQTCVDGSQAAWVEIATEDDDAEELEYPAPAVALTADGGTTGPDAWSIAALLAGLIGLLVGGAALAAARRGASV